MKQLFIIIFVLVAFVAGMHSSPMSDENPFRGKTIWDLPSIAEEDIDVGYWALVIAKECDSSVDVDKYLHVLDTMVARIKYMVGPREGDMVRFMMTKMYQFDAGEWNDSSVYSYDLDDPLGEKPGARLLTTYLDTRKGNCVSMPTLFLALMERVDTEIPFHGVPAPFHLFCRLYDRQDGSTWNVEATNGGNSGREQWYIESFGISQLAIDSGSYMRDLTKREFVAELLGIVTSRYRAAKDYETALRYADLALELNQKSLTGLVQKGALLGWLGHTLQQQILSENRPPTPEEERKLRPYKEESDNYISRAQSLGWAPESSDFREQYLKTIREARQNENK